MTHTTAARNSTRHWQALDREHHLHPFTDHKSLHKRGSRVITKAEGVYLWDSEGHRLLDGMAGLWCVNIGYGRSELSEAARRQMDELPYYNTFFQTSHPPVTELAQRLSELSPGDLNHVFFTNSGSECNDTVVRMVRRYWEIVGQPQRQIILSRENSYHGSTVAALSLGGMKPMHEQGGNTIAGVEHVMQPYWYRLAGDTPPEEFGLQAARDLENRITRLGPDKVAAFIAEPVQGAGGIIVPPDSYWPEVTRICKKHDILFVADEVICGFGRTGSWFGTQTYALEPDLMSTAKGLSSGYQPIGAVMVNDRVASTLVDGGEFYHGFTYSGHPVAAAVALENLRILEKESIVEIMANETAPYFQARVRELEDHPLVGEVRGVGMLAAIELSPNKTSRDRFDPEGDAGAMCRDYAMSHGLVMRATLDSMLLSPPLIITKAQVDEALGVARACLDLTAKAYGVR